MNATQTLELVKRLAHADKGKTDEPHGQRLERLAREHGFKDYNTLCAIAKREDVDYSDVAVWLSYGSEAAAKQTLLRNFPDLLSTDGLLKLRDGRWGFWLDRTTRRPVSGSLEEDES